MDDRRDAKEPSGLSGKSAWSGRADYLRLIRLFRGRAIQEITDSTREILRQAIEDGLDGLMRERAAAPGSAATNPQLAALGGAWLGAATKADQPLPAQLPVAPTNLPSQGDDDAPVSRASEIERLRLRIRQLVRSDQSWEQIRPVATRWYELESDPEVAAKIVELAALHGDYDDVSRLFADFANNGFAFVAFIHPKLRTILVLQFWQAGEHELLKRAIVRNQAALRLTEIEHLYVLFVLLSAAQVDRIFDYFSKNEAACVGAAREHGHLVRFDINQMALGVGNAANEIGFADEARRILRMVDKDSQQHADARDLSVKLFAEQETLPAESFAKKIFAEADWRLRLRTLRDAFERLRIEDAARQGERGTVNALLAEPLRLVPQLAEAYQELAALLYEFRDLDTTLPYLSVLFKEHAVVYLSADLDASLWRPLRGDGALQNGRDFFWAAVAALHEYVGCGVNAEAALWRAREYYAVAQDLAETTLPHTWADLHRSALAHISKVPHLIEAQRVQMLRQLRIAAEDSHVAGSDIEEYLRETPTPPFQILAKLQHIVRTKGDVDLEIKIITKRALRSHLTNDDLDCMWQLASRLANHDLCWRIASILMSRKALTKLVVPSWEISGERRTDYGAIIPDEAELKLAAIGFAPLEHRLINAMLKVGPELPELLAILDAGAKPHKPQVPMPQSHEEDVDKILARIGWLPAQKKMYRFSLDGFTAPAQLPAFVQVMPSNAWSFLLVRLAERLGLNAWGWKLSRLYAQIQDLIPRLATRQDLSRYSMKVARWLRSLSPEQRSAWYDVSSLCTKIGDERAVEVLILFLSRLATMIHQSHYQALNSLHTMRAPVSVIWELETWLLSEEYTTYRRVKGTCSRVAVQPNLQTLDTVLS